jgi:hypothetical protein
MHPFVAFAIFLIVIWTLSGIASAASKKTEQERRRRMAQEMMRAGGTPQAPPALPPQRRIAQGLAARYPQVLRPPQPAQRRSVKPAVRRPAPIRTVAQPAVVHHIAQPFRSLDTPPIRPAAPTAAITTTPARSARPLASASASHSADAPAIARWLSPRTMQQQFILTEILQPPLALREQQAGDLR